MSAEVLIHPEAPSLKTYLATCRASFDSLKVLVWKDIKLRYRNLSLGIALALLQPILGTGVLQWVLHWALAKELAGRSIEISDILTTLCGFLVFQFLAKCIFRGSAALRENHLLSLRVYFPRLFLPVAAVLSSFFDFLLGAIPCTAIALYLHPGSYGVSRLVAFIVGTGAMLLAGTAVAALLSAVDAVFESFRFGVPFLLQVLLFLSPVFFTSSSASSSLFFVLHLNPFAAPAELLRYSWNLGLFPPASLLVCSIGLSLLLFSMCVVLFQRKEHRLSESVR